MKIFLVLIFILVPTLTYGFTASDFIVNPQPTYAVPPGTTQVLILDLTLPEPIDSIKFENGGTVEQYNISQLTIFDDGDSAGWDGDETELTRKSSSPFFGVEIDFPKFSEERIFVTLDITSDTASGRTLKLKAVIGDISVSGLERMILAGVGLPTTPLTPIAKTPEALSTSTIRWHFEDRSNNEFGFKILDGNLKEITRNETADISYLDETGLQPNTEYSGRRVVAFNDRGESLSSSLTIFPAIRTLKEEITTEEVSETASTEEKVEEEKVGEKVAELSLLEKIQAKIIEIQQKINELLKQLNELIGQQTAGIWQALQGFFQAFFGK